MDELGRADEKDLDLVPHFFCCILLVVVTFDLSTAVAQRQVLRTQKNVDRQPLRYLLYVPERSLAAESEPLPLLLFLHGGGEGGNDIERVKKHGPPKLIAEGKSFPFIVVSPQNPSTIKLPLGEKNYGTNTVTATESDLAYERRLKAMSHAEKVLRSAAMFAWTRQQMARRIRDADPSLCICVNQQLIETH